MGDRANVAFRIGGSDANPQHLVLYGHWAGSTMPERLRRALDSNECRRRWGDPTYCVRIVLSRMLTQEEHEAETGFGLWSGICDTNYRVVLEVDADRSMVFLRRLTPDSDIDTSDGGVLDSWHFKDYCDLSLDGVSLGDVRGCKPPATQN